MQTMFSEACVSKCLELAAYAAAILGRSILTPYDKLLCLARPIE